MRTAKLIVSAVIAALSLLVTVPASSSGGERFYLGRADGKPRSSIGLYVRDDLGVQAFVSVRRRCFEYGEQVSAGRGATETKRIVIEDHGDFRKRTHTRIGGNPRRRATALIEGTVRRSTAVGSTRERYTSPIPGGVRVCKTGDLKFKLKRTNKVRYVRAIEKTGLNAAPGLRSRGG